MMDTEALIQTTLPFLTINYILQRSIPMVICIYIIQTVQILELIQSILKLMDFHTRLIISRY